MMLNFRILSNGFIKTFVNGDFSQLLFNTDIQVKGLLSDGFIQI